MRTAPLVVSTAGVVETLELGRRIGEAIEPGWIIGLVGELGVGKTHLVKGISAGNWTGQGPVAEVTSPTFVLVNEYSGRVTLFHLDAYRLGANHEMVDLGVDEMVQSGAVVVEWADRVAGALPADRINIAGRSIAENERLWEFSAGGPRSNEWLARL